MTQHPIDLTQGGTGVNNNSASTITVSGNFPLTLTLTASSNVILPTSGTLITSDITTFTGTLTGMTSTTTGSVTAVRCGPIATLYITANILGTSNSASVMEMTGLPIEFIPVNSQTIRCTNIQNNSTPGLGGAVIFGGSGNGTLMFTLDSVSGTSITTSTTYTSSGTKGLNAGWCVTYSLL